MNKEQIKRRIEEIKKKKTDEFLTLDELTHGFYNGQILIYEKWLSSLPVK